MPTPNETQILRIAKEEKEVDKVLISTRMGISAGYSAHLLNYLVRKSLLEEVPARKGTHKTAPRHKLTRKGALALLAELHHVAGKYALAVRRTIFLKDIIDEKINELTDYIEGEFPEKKMSSRKKESGALPFDSVQAY